MISRVMCYNWATFPDIQTGPATLQTPRSLTHRSIPVSTPDCTPVDQGVKRCTKCGETKALGEFSPDRRNRTGRQARCRSCCRELARNRYATNHEFRERAKATTREWYAKNRNRAIAYWHDYCEANREQTRENARRWAAENRDRRKDIEDRRRARKFGGLYERVSRAVVFERDGGICHICGTAVDPDSWHLDHVIALANGGNHTYSNVAVSHPICNERKGVKPCA